MPVNTNSSVNTNSIPYELNCFYPELTTISFQVQNNKTPILQIMANGDFIVKGKLVTNDIEIYHTMKEFLSIKR